MTCYREITCPNCARNDIKKSGRSASGAHRYRCCNSECTTQTFMLNYRYKAYEPGIKNQIIDMALNSSGIRDTARVLGVNKNTVINTLKSKADSIVHVNPNMKNLNSEKGLDVRFKLACDEAEVDEQWSFVGSKSNQRWLWYAVDHATNTVLAFVFGKRRDGVFKKLKALLEPLGISRFYTDDWGAYERHIDDNKHIIGKHNTQKIERKNLNFRTWIKRLARKTICFSKLDKMHDTVLGLLINKVEFGLDIYA